MYRVPIPRTSYVLQILLLNLFTFKNLPALNAPPFSPRGPLPPGSMVFGLDRHAGKADR